MFIVDTNIWLELLLGQQKANETIQMLETIPLNILNISDFSLHSIGVILDRYKKHKEFNDFVNDIVIEGKTNLIQLSAIELQEVAILLQKTGFDFDDAYQTIVMQTYDLQLITFDKDFAKQDVISLTPLEAIEFYKKHQE